MANVVEFSVKCPACWVIGHRQDDGTIIAAKGGRFHGLGLCVTGGADDREAAAENLGRAVRSSGLDLEAFHAAQFEKAAAEFEDAHAAGVPTYRIQSAAHEAEAVYALSEEVARKARVARLEAEAAVEREEAIKRAELDAARAEEQARLDHEEHERDRLAAEAADAAAKLQAETDAKITAEAALAADAAAKLAAERAAKLADVPTPPAVTVTEAPTAPEVSPEPSPEPETAARPAKGKKGK